MHRISLYFLYTRVDMNNTSVFSVTVLDYMLKSTLASFRSEARHKSYASENAKQIRL
jgi:hypothetical protein